MDARMLAAQMQQMALQSQAKTSGLRTAVQTASASGEKLASNVKGDYVSFAKLLSVETEKQRRAQTFRQEQEQGRDKVQPML